MAEERSNKQQQDSVNSVAKGLNQDFTPNVQPEGTYRFALNAAAESKEGNQGFLINEEGNYQCGKIDKNYWIPIGHVYLDNDTALVFLANTDPIYLGYGRIITVSRDCAIKIYLTADCFNFRVTKQIDAEYRVRKGCERVVYFTDDFNDIRAINIDSLDNYLNAGAVYDPEDATIWDCETFKFFPDYKVPHINFESLSETGSLDSGVYQFSARYLDQDGNPTNWFPITQPIPVYKDPTSNIEFDIKGEYTGTKTNKAINLSFTNLDPSFDFIEIAVLPSTVGTGQINGSIYIVDKVAIGGSSVLYSCTSVDTASATVTSLDDIIVDRIVYSRAKTIKQLQNRLIIGNLQGKEINYDWAKFQTAALSSRVQYITKTCSTEDAAKDSVQSGSYYFDYRTFMRDEVYALAVVWVLKDGTRTPAFHIPGRRSNGYSTGVPIPTGIDPNNPAAPGYIMGETNRLVPPPGQRFDTMLIPGGVDDPNVQPFDITPNTLQRWEVYNTAIRTRQTFVNGELETEGDPGYFECSTAVYPSTRDCDGNFVYGSLASRPVRHHRMPDTTLETHFYGDKSITYGDMFQINTPGDNPAVNAGGSGSNLILQPLCNQPFDPGSGAKIVSLGLKVTITPPADYVNDIQGFYIVRARRGDNDRSVLDKGLLGYNQIAYTGFQGKGSTGPSIDNCHFLFQSGQLNKQLDSFSFVHRTFEVGAGTSDDGCKPGVDTASPGWGIGTIQSYKPNAWLPLGDLINCQQCWQGTGGARKQFSNALTNQQDWCNCQETTGGVPPPQPGPIPYSDWNEQLGNGYPTSFTGGNVGQTVCDSAAAITFDTPVTPLGNVSYHGPLSKFKNIPTFTYIKVEKILSGYTAAIVCNSAGCDNDIGAGMTLTKEGIGIYKENREDGHTTYLLDKFSFHQHNVPYANVQAGIGNSVISKPGFIDGTGGAQNGTCPNNPVWAHITNFTALYYEQPLYNITIEDSVKIGLNSVVSVAAFDDIFDNFQGQEALVLQLSEVGETPAQYKLAYPGTGGITNTGVFEFSAIGIDRSYSRQFCYNLLSSPYNLLPLDAPTPFTKEEVERGLSTSYYVSTKKLALNAFGDITSLVYQSTSTNISYSDSTNPSLPVISTVFGGDSFVSRFAFRRTQWSARCGRTIEPKVALTIRPDISTDNCSDPDSYSTFSPFPDTTGGSTIRETGGPTAGGQDRKLLNNNIIWYWVESFINTELRNGRDTTAERFYPYYFEGTSLLGPYSFVDSENVYDTGAAGPTVVSVIEDENYYDINDDYLKECTENAYFPLGPLFDYCNAINCGEDFPHRIAYSTQSFQDSQQDNYRTFLANNYRDLPGNRGEIWDLFTLNNVLYVQTEESLWKVLPSTQMSTLNDTTVYIGTGEFFTNPPVEVLESQTGYMGNQSQWATIISENGMFWPDARQGKVFGFNTQPTDYSIKGLRNWFENNMNMEIYDQYLAIFGTPFPSIDNPAAPHGAGYLGVYDPRYVRYILTKKDYLLRAPYDTINPLDPAYRAIQYHPDYGVWHANPPAAGICNCITPQWMSNISSGPVAVSTITNPGYCTYTFSVIDGSGNITNYEELIPCLGTILTNTHSGWGAGPCVSENRLDTPIEVEGVGTIRDLNDVFDCRSWTISYSMVSSSWASWHSYMPNYYIGAKNFFWSSLNLFSMADRLAPAGHLWRHQLTTTHNNYQQFYGITEPHILELISNVNPLQVTVGDYYHFITDAWIYDSKNRKYLETRYTTFDKVYLYNSYQCSGYLTMTVKDTNIGTMASQSVLEALGSVNIDRKERIWRLNEFNDLAINRNIPAAPTLFLQDWADLTFQGQYFIDEVINTAAVSGTKSWFDRAPFRDKYLGIRLFFSNLGENEAKIKLVTDYIWSQSTHSPR